MGRRESPQLDIRAVPDHPEILHPPPELMAADSQKQQLSLIHICLAKKKNIRLMELPDCAKPNEPGTLDMKKVVGGLLVQELDTKLLGDELKVVTKRAPSEEEMEQLLFAWKVVKQTKSNAIVLAKDSATCLLYTSRCV